MHKPESVLENETHKIFFDFEMQTDHQFLTRKPDQVLIKKNRTCHWMDFTVPTDNRVKMKEKEKIDKYLDLARELKSNRLVRFGFMTYCMLFNDTLYVIWFYDILYVILWHIVCYLIPNRLYTYILNIYMIGKHILLITFVSKPELFLHTAKWFQVLLYDSHNLASVICLHTWLVLFDTWIGPYQVLPLRVRVDLGTMAMKRYSTFLKFLRLEPYHQMA